MSDDVNEESKEGREESPVSTPCVLKISLSRSKHPTSSSVPFEEAQKLTHEPSSTNGGDNCDAWVAADHNTAIRGDVESKELDNSVGCGEYYRQENAGQSRQNDPPTVSLFAPSYTPSPSTRLPGNVSVASEFKVENSPGYKAIGQRMPLSVAVIDGTVFEEFQTPHEKYGVRGSTRCEFGIATVRGAIKKQRSTLGSCGKDMINNVYRRTGASNSTPVQSTRDETPYAYGHHDTSQNTGAAHGPAQVHIDDNNYGRCSQSSDSFVYNDATISTFHNSDQSTDLAGEDTSEWVQCDHPLCLKWRRVPPFVNMASLPNKWVCADNYWDPSKASCNVTEDPYYDSDEDTIEYKDTNNDFDDEDYVDEEYSDEDHDDEIHDIRNQKRSKRSSAVNAAYRAIGTRVGQYGKYKLRRSARQHSKETNAEDNDVRRSGRVRHSTKNNEDFVSTDCIMDLVADESKEFGLLTHQKRKRAYNKRLHGPAGTNCNDNQFDNDEEEYHEHYGRYNDNEYNSGEDDYDGDDDYNSNDRTLNEGDGNCSKVNLTDQNIKECKGGNLTMDEEQPKLSLNLKLCFSRKPCSTSTSS